MNFLSIASIFSPIFNTLIERLFPDPEKKQEAELAMQQAMNAAQAEADKAYAAQIEAQRDVIVAEANSQSWAARNWRPYLMMMCIAIVGYNWIAVGFLNAILYFAHTQITAMPIPPELWTLVTVGLGGYIGKETISTYSENKYKFNEDKYFSVLRKLFPNGMSQSQVDILNQAKDAAISEDQ